MGIRAKFYVSSVAKFANGSEQVEAHAANGRKDTANAQWAKFTPGGKLMLTIDNPAAQGQLLPGKYYFLDLTESDEDAL